MRCLFQCSTNTKPPESETSPKSTSQHRHSDSAVETGIGKSEDYSARSEL